MYTQSRPTVPGFQSTLLQEERQFLSFASGSYFYFQSTLLQEERRPTQRGKMRYLYLSIHAPTRGATNGKANPWLITFFQSTLLQEERHGFAFFGSPDSAFNPRSYKRSDNMCEECRDEHYIFQSTLLQEERQQKCTIFLMHLCNNYCIVSI